MPSRTTIEIDRLSKRFGAVEAVSGLTFTVEPGTVTGFLGPNGAGKTTTLRMLLGLVRPTEGTATIGGTSYRDLDRPLATVGTALEAASFHPGRTARNHLAVYAAAAGIPRARVGAVLDLVGLGAYGDRRVGGYSLGMRQRLGLAMALLGDPQVLVLDEPFGALDALTRLQMQDLLLDIHTAEPTTIVLVTHDVEEALYLADRVVLIGETPTAPGSGSGIRSIIDVPGARPRDRGDAQLAHLRAELLRGLGVHTHHSTPSKDAA